MTPAHSSSRFKLSSWRLQQEYKRQRSLVGVDLSTPRNLRAKPKNLVRPDASLADFWDEVDAHPELPHDKEVLHVLLVMSRMPGADSKRPVVTSQLSDFATTVDCNRMHHDRSLVVGQRFSSPDRSPDLIISNFREILGQMTLASLLQVNTPDHEIIERTGTYDACAQLASL